MTNEEFKELYEDALSHGWVSSLDSAKAALQKQAEKAYNAEYYKKHKDKWAKKAKDASNKADQAIRKTLLGIRGKSSLNRNAAKESEAMADAARKRTSAQQRKMKEFMDEVQRKNKERDRKLQERQLAQRRADNAYAANAKRRRNAANNVDRSAEEYYSYMNAMSDAAGRHKKSADKRAAANRTHREVEQRNRSSYETKAREKSAKIQRERKQDYKPDLIDRKRMERLGYRKKGSKNRSSSNIRRSAMNSKMW